MNRLQVLSILCTMLFSVACRAQDITDVEAKPYGSFSEGKIDTVNIQTGNVMLDIPLLSYPQRGSLPPLTFSVELNNAPYAQGGWDCDPLGNSDGTWPQNGYQMECQAYSSRYDPSPPGSPYQFSTINPILPIEEALDNNVPGCGPEGNLGVPCGYEEVWGAEAPGYSLQTMGAYITSSFAGGIAVGTYAWQSDGTQNGGVGDFAFNMIDPSGTTRELQSDDSNRPTSWNLFHAADGSGYTFIPTHTSFASPAGRENAYNIFEPMDGLCWFDANADWLGNAPNCWSGVRLGTLISPTGIKYSDTITTYPNGNSGINVPKALYSTESDPSGNTITRGPWYWSGYWAPGSNNVFTDIQNIYSNASQVPPPAPGYTPGPYYVDSIGRVIPDILSIQSTQIAGNDVVPWTVPGPNNQNTTYTVSYAPIGNTITFAGNNSTINPDPSTAIAASGLAIESIKLPNNTYWTFNYSGADLQSVGLPTGGTISYQYMMITPATVTDPPSPSQAVFNSIIFEARCNATCHAIQSRTETDALGDSWTTRYSYGTYFAMVNALPTAICPTITPTPDSPTSQFSFWTTETDPNGNDTVHSFCALGVPNNAGFPVENAYHEVLTQYYQGSAPSPQGSGSTAGALLKTIQTQFETQFDILPIVPTNNPGTIFAAPTQITTTTPKGGLTTEVKTYSGDSSQNQPLVILTKIGCGAGYGEINGSINACSPANNGPQNYGIPSYQPYSLNISYLDPVVEATYPAWEQNNPSQLLRKTTTTFEFQSPIGASYTNANLVALPRSVVVADNASTGTTNYSYDENGSPQGAYGNLTTMSESYSMGGSTSTHAIFNSQGMPVTKTDGRGYSTTITYDTSGLFPNKIQRPTTSNDVPHADYYNYDGNTGLLNWHTDENGSSAGDSAHTTSYSYDVMGRVTSIGYPDGGGSTFCYTDLGGSIPGCSVGSAPFSLYTSTTASPNPAVLTVHSYDGFGRQYRSQVLGDAGGPTIVDTTHDWDGRTLSVSNPYRGSPLAIANPPCGSSNTCFTYDALGRKTIQTQPDGSRQQWCYDGLGTYANQSDQQTQCLGEPLAIFSWDETGRQTEQQLDYLGRLASVSDAVTSANYGYDVFNDLVSVSQSGGPSRSFAYDMPSRVTWACNPETLSFGQNCSSGHPGITFVYDGNSNPTQKTDNRSITTYYAYDSLNRLLSKTYTDGTASACFQYDGTSVPNGVGRLTSQWTQSGACLSSSAVQTRSAFTSYDAMGRLLSEQRCMGISNCANGGYAMTYTYDLAGKLTSYPSGFGGLSFSNTYDALGRLQSVSNATQNYTLFSNPGYTPAGALSQALYGTGIGMTRSFDVRQRITGETDSSGANTSSVPGTASVSIRGSEQKN